MSHCAAKGAGRRSAGGFLQLGSPETGLAYHGWASRRAMLVGTHRSLTALLRLRKQATRPSGTGGAFYGA
jgi:hypothetical protein